jgi:pimeloyl-ACP methyl ester carboxylesterase
VVTPAQHRIDRRTLWGVDREVRDGSSVVNDRLPPIEAPTAVTVFPRELLRVPRRLMERQANVARWTAMPRGGHFAPAEEPELMLEDIRAFFRGFR